MATLPAGALPSEHVAIVGAGFTGTLLAINLLRHAGPAATLIERRPSPARGTAYSTLEPGHLLNVRAGNMSALPDEPGHFTAWLARHRPDEPADFVSRGTYGAYLADQLAAAAARSGGRLRVVRGDAVDAAVDAGGATVRLADGTSVAADRLVLATGNLPPSAPPPLARAALPPHLYAADPWDTAALDGLDRDAPVLVVGTGLTMIDVAVLLDRRGHRGPVWALSRHGLLPRAHAGVPPPERLHEHPRPAVLALLRHLRARAREVDWRLAVDELRPVTQTLWHGASAAERRRFLRHARAWWDVHRHRIAPRIADRLADWQATGRLRVVAGSLVTVRAEDDRAVATYRPRHAAAPATLTVARVVNCTGPAGLLERSGEPLLRALEAAGAIRADPLRLGIDVDVESRALDRDGAASGRLFAAGPLTRGAFWEIVAVPDIRRQVWALARQLANARWVAGEGL